MLGWINISICSFICGTFGVEKWEAVVAAAGVTPNWASSCPYSDKVTYE
jgi:guanylate cyclase soluble subunit beta